MTDEESSVPLPPSVADLAQFPRYVLRADDRHLLYRLHRR